MIQNPQSSTTRKDSLSVHRVGLSLSLINPETLFSHAYYKNRLSVSTPPGSLPEGASILQMLCVHLFTLLKIILTKLWHERDFMVTC